MKPVSTACDEVDLLTLESCEDGLDFLAYSIREDLAEGRATSHRTLEETRGIASELLAYAAKTLASSWRPSFESGAEPIFEPRLLRLIRAIRGALHPASSRRELAEGLQSAADLIRSTRRFDHVGVALH